MKKLSLSVVIIFLISTFAFPVCAVDNQDVQDSLPALQIEADRVGGRIRYPMPLVRSEDIAVNGLSFDELKESTDYTMGLVYVDDYYVGHTSVKKTDDGTFEPSSSLMAGRPAPKQTIEQPYQLAGYEPIAGELIKTLDYDDIIYVWDNYDFYLIIKNADASEEVVIVTIPFSQYSYETGDRMKLDEFLTAAAVRNAEYASMSPELVGLPGCILEHLGKPFVLEEIPQPTRKVSFELIIFAVLAIGTAIVIVITIVAAIVKKLAKAKKVSAEVKESLPSE